MVLLMSFMQMGPTLEPNMIDAVEMQEVHMVPFTNTALPLLIKIRNNI